MSYPHRGEPLPDGKCGRERSPRRESLLEKIKLFFERKDMEIGNDTVEVILVEEPEQ